MNGLLAALLIVSGASWATGDSPPTLPGPVRGNHSAKGAVIETLGQDELTDLRSSYWRSASAGGGPFYDYASVSTCGSPRPGDPGANALCAGSFLLCVSTTGGGDGPALAVWRREVDADGDPVGGAAGEWAPRGITCLPDLVPGAENVLTMAMIEKAFHATDFTVPTVNIQPEGDVTLVNLPTFFEVVLPEDGFGPDEVDRPDPATLLGYDVEVRPRLKSVTYDLGETTVGPTTDFGGPYPSGSVTHEYSRPGQQQVRADIVYTGQFRVAGSDWVDIPGEVALQGEPVTLTVREARSRLYGS